MAVGSVDGDGNDAAVWTSTDAVTWNRATGTDLGGPGNQWMDAVTSGPLGLVAVGSSSTDEGGSTGAVWTSADGLSWTRVPNDEAAFAAVLADTGESTMNLFDVVAGGPGYVAVGAEAVTDQSVVLVSVDGQTWSRQSPSEIDIWVSSITVEAGPAGVLVVGARDGNPTGTGAPIDMWILAP